MVHAIHSVLSHIYIMSLQIRFSASRYNMTTDVSVAVSFGTDTKIHASHSKHSG